MGSCPLSRGTTPFTLGSSMSVRKPSKAKKSGSKAKRSKAKKSASETKVRKRSTRFYATLDGKRQRVSKKVWDAFHPRYTEGPFKGRFRPQPKVVRWPTVKGKARRRANKETSAIPRKLRKTALESPRNTTTVCFEKPTGIDWDSRLHNADVILGMLADTFYNARESMNGRLVVTWRGGCTFRLSKEQREDGTPIWGPRVGASSGMRIQFDKALKEARSHLLALMEFGGMGEGESKYRIWIRSVKVWAKLPSAVAPKGMKRIRRRGRFSDADERRSNRRKGTKATGHNR